ncbi:MAG: LiaI-LiaF-like domain-containing protein [Bacillota bacterium]
MQPRKVVGGILLIAFGLIFLLNNIGILDWSVWAGIARLWPLLIILAGVNLIFRHSRWGVIISVLVIAVGILTALVWPMEQIYRWSGTQQQGHWSQPLNAQINTLDVDLALKGAKFSISPSTNLADMDYIYYGAAPKIIFNDNNGKGNLSIGEEKFIIWGPGWKRNGPELKLGLNPDVLLNLNLNIGAVDGDFDLSQMTIDRLSINTGASDLDIRLGNRNPLTTVEINAGASKLVIRVPFDSGVRLDASGAINRVDFDQEEFQNLDGKMVSFNYANATSKVDVLVSSGVSQLSIERY